MEKALAGVLLLGLMAGGPYMYMSAVAKSNARAAQPVAVVDPGPSQTEVAYLTICTKHVEAAWKLEPRVYKASLKTTTPADACKCAGNGLEKAGITNDELSLITNMSRVRRGRPSQEELSALGLSQSRFEAQQKVVKRDVKALRETIGDERADKVLNIHTEVGLSCPGKLPPPPKDKKKA